MRNPEEANKNVDVALEGSQGKEKPDVRLKILTSRLSLIRAALLRGTPSFAGVNIQALSEDQRARLKYIAGLRAFFEKLAQEADLINALGPELNTLAEYDALTESTEAQEKTAKTQPPKAAPPHGKAKEEQAVRPRNEFERMLAIIAQAKAVKQFTREEEIQAFTDYNDLKRDLIDALFKEPDALRAAMLLCMPILKTGGSHEFAFYFFHMGFSHLDAPNPLDDFLAGDRIRDVDKMADAYELKGGSAKKNAQSKVDPHIAAEVRKYGGEFLREGAEQSRAQAAQYFARLRVSPAALEAIAQFSSGGDGINIPLAKIKKMQEAIIGAYSFTAAYLAKKHMRRGDDASFAYSCGLQGLSLATDKFDLKYNVRFWSYAGYWIKAALHNGLKRERECIHIPEGVDVKELVGFFGLRYVRSLDAPFGAHNDAPDAAGLLEMVPDDASKTPEAQLTRASLDDRNQGLVQYFLDRNGFTPREQHIVRQRLMSDQPPTLEEIGRELEREVGHEIGVCRERARQLEKRVFKKLQRCAERLGLKPEDVFD